jgi:hypothetical protein
MSAVKSTPCTICSEFYPISELQPAQQPLPTTDEKICAVCCQILKSSQSFIYYDLSKLDSVKILEIDDLKTQTRNKLERLIKQKKIIAKYALLADEKLSPVLNDLERQMISLSAIFARDMTNKRYNMSCKLNSLKLIDQMLELYSKPYQVTEGVTLQADDQNVLPNRRYIYSEIQKEQATSVLQNEPTGSWFLCKTSKKLDRGPSHQFWCIYYKGSDNAIAEKYIHVFGDEQEIVATAFSEPNDIGHLHVARLEPLKFNSTYPRANHSGWGPYLVQSSLFSEILIELGLAPPTFKPTEEAKSL